MTTEPLAGVRLVTERFLTWRKRRKFRKKQKQKKKNVILDWVEAFLWAAVVVLLINQYLLQAYMIPSGSMIPTLEREDRIFVNKVVYGPELVPGLAKLPGFEEPERGEVIIFENPEYIGRGPIFDIVQRVLYMVTLSLVDIDRGADGEPRPHFLIKRAVGVAGDRMRNRDGNLEIRPAGAEEWYPEQGFKELVGLEYPVRRLLSPSDYEVIANTELAAELRRAGLPVTGAAASPGRLSSGTMDSLTANAIGAYERFRMNPDAVESAGATFARYDKGWYVPPGRVMPLGDNRDNSRDGRYFGPVLERFVLGRAMFKYWPIGRIGAIE